MKYSAQNHVFPTIHFMLYCGKSISFGTQCRPIFFLTVYICQLHIWTLYLLKFGWCRVEQSCFRFIMQVAKLFSNKPLILTGHFHALTKTIKEPLSYKMWPIKKCTYPISPPFELHSLPSNGCNSTLIQQIAIKTFYIKFKKLDKTLKKRFYLI